MTDSFLGVPVHGIIQQSETFRVEQRPLEELTPLLQDVLDDPNVVRFGWVQYTPYFNDGDPCVFGVYSPYALPLGEDPDELGDDYWSFQEKYGDIGPYSDFWATYAKICPDTYARLLAMSGAIESGAFNSALLEKFGDHAIVTIQRDGITIEGYDHD